MPVICALALLINVLWLITPMAASTRSGHAATDPDPKPGLEVVRFTGPGGADSASDSTVALQEAITRAAREGKVLEIPAATAPYIIGPLFFPSNADVIVDANVVMEARQGFKLSDKLLNIVDVNNVRIRGAGSSVFQMRKADYRSGEYRHCLNIEGATAIFISGISCNNSGGDGVYIGSGSRGYSSDITIEDCIFDGNRRQGLSIVSGSNISIYRSRFSNTRGTKPSDGIDIEPNGPNDRLSAISLVDNLTFGNDGNGLAIDVRNLARSSYPVTINVLRNNSWLNNKSGYYVTNQKNGQAGATGRITIERSTSTSDGQYGALGNYYEASGPCVLFDGLTVLNPNRLRFGTITSAIAVRRGGGGKGRIGNISFTNTSILDTLGTINTYFTFVDYSGIGFSSVRFVMPGKLQGAKKHAGTFDGRPAIAVDFP
jgi:parallel beta-helix repeat protein